MKKPLSQNEMILKYLETGKSITPLEALQRFRCFRLGARIYEIKEKYNRVIISEPYKTLDGKTVAKYTLGDIVQNTPEPKTADTKQPLVKSQISMNF
jgi:hypothetical protein